MRVLVTGANGFIGSEVTKSLSLAGHTVVALVRSIDRASKDREETVVADLNSLESLSSIDDEYEAVVHCAGLAHLPSNTPLEQFVAGNVETTANIARFAVKNNIKRFIHVSSVSVYGNASYDGHAIDEATICEPASPYAESKLRAEEACKRILDESGVSLTILRPSTVIGVNDPGNIVKFIKLIHQGKFVPAGDGKNKKSFVDVRDLAGAVAAAMATECEHEVYNVTAPPVSTAEILNSVCRGLGKAVPALWVPRFAVDIPAKVLKAGSRSSRIAGLADSLQKWLAEDVYSGARLSEFYQVKFSADVALEYEAKWFLDQQ